MSVVSGCILAHRHGRRDPGGGTQRYRNERWCCRRKQRRCCHQKCCCWHRRQRCCQTRLQSRPLSLADPVVSPPPSARTCTHANVPDMAAYFPWRRGSEEKALRGTKKLPHHARIAAHLHPCPCLHEFGAPSFQSRHGFWLWPFLLLPPRPPPPLRLMSIRRGWSVCWLFGACPVFLLLPT